MLKAEARVAVIDHSAGQVIAEYSIYLYKLNASNDLFLLQRNSGKEKEMDCIDQNITVLMV